jgi:hypothetical protein
MQHPRATIDKGAPTSTMKIHIKIKCTKIRKPKNIGDGALSRFFNNVQSDITQGQLDEQILKFFISGNIPFNQADNPEFQKLIAMIKVNGISTKCPG